MASTHSGETTVLVTGASGLLGGRLLAALRGDASVRVRAGSRVARAWPAGVGGVVIDATAPDSLRDACDGADAVVNLAAMSERDCAAEPDRALRANTGGTLALVRAASDAGVGRFVQVSTAKVYGVNARGVVTEDTPTCPASHYAITHRASEDYAALHPHAVVLRLANGFGAPVGDVPGAWSVVVNDFCRQAASTARIELRGDERAWRSFVPMDDITAAIVAATTALPAGTYNLGAAHDTTLRAMADRVAAVAESVLGNRVEVHAMRAGGAPPAPLDYRTDRLRSAGFAPVASIDEEIARTLRAAAATVGRVRHG